MRNEFIQAIKTHQTAFGLELPDEAIERLADYFDLVMEHNPLLHLVGPCSPEEFAIRHILESLTLLNYLPQGARFADVGAGAGLPSVPCLLVRDDLKALLIESKEKKIAFLREVATECKLTDRVELVGSQFSEVKPNVSHITCRALDKFSQKVPHLIKWAKNCSCLFFGGPALKTALEKCRIEYNEYLLPMSDQRYLFVIQKK
ncbi:MAG: class I SAM-dependent methyltransferase [Chloracidobacterium sp.]|nr:class I SAM-dependent methyltransferase [Chloracidobacterium sp.]